MECVKKKKERVVNLRGSQKNTREVRWGWGENDVNTLLMYEILKTKTINKNNVINNIQYNFVSWELMGHCIVA